MILRGRVIKEGKVQGEALVSPEPIGFLGGVDPETGIIVEPGHPLEGECIAGKVLVFPTGKGSTVGSYTLYRLARKGLAPAAIVNAESDPVVAVGAIIAEIPMVDRIDIESIETGDMVSIEGGLVKIIKGVQGAVPPAGGLGDELSRLSSDGIPSRRESSSGVSPKNSPSPSTTELVFLKLGGSLITDKGREATAREGIIRRAAREIKGALEARPDLRLLIGHGSGSFGHFVAQRYGTREGARDKDGWWGYAATGAAAAQLNRLVTGIFLQEGVPVVSFQPSASALCRAGELIRLEIEPIREVLSHHLVPMVYGDVALDEIQGCTIISTEQIFAYLARRLEPNRMILAGIVDGVFTADPLQDPEARLIEEISPANFSWVEGMLAGSYGVDVTGGMLAKIRAMYDLVCNQPSLTVRLISGMRPGLIERALLDPGIEEGTLLHCPKPRASTCHRGCKGV